MKLSYYDEKFYYEPSEFDIQVDEFKETLTNSVKEEYVSEMERLKKENEKLQSVKENFEEIKREYENKKHQLNLEHNKLKQQVRRERLSELMKDVEVIMYRAWSKRDLPPKCNKCDDKRQIKYKTPLGKDAYENCDCSKGETVYYPREHICNEFIIDRDGSKMNAWYKVITSSGDEYALLDSSTFANIYHENLRYEDINRYNTFFKSKEECQGYCDYLNSEDD